MWGGEGDAVPGCGQGPALSLQQRTLVSSSSQRHRAMGPAQTVGLADQLMPGSSCPKGRAGTGVRAGGGGGGRGEGVGRSVGGTRRREEGQAGEGDSGRGPGRLGLTCLVLGDEDTHSAFA